MTNKTSGNSQSDSFPSFDNWLKDQGYNPGFTQPDLQQTDVQNQPAAPAEFPSFDAWVQQNGYGQLVPPGGIQTPDAQHGELYKGWMRGGKQLQALAHGTAAAVGDLVGWDSMKESQIADYQRLMKEAEQYAPEVGSVEEIDSPGKFLSWATGVLGEQLPNVIGFAVSGGFGALIGKLAAKKAITGLVEHELKKKVAQWGARGALGTSYAFSTTMEAGGQYGEQVDAGVKTNPALALGGGAVSGVLEMAAPVTVARMLGLGKQFESQLMRNISQLPMAKRMLVSGALVGGEEAATETMQEVVGLTTRQIVDQNYDALGPDGRSRLLNAAAGGGMGGLAFGLVGGVRRHTYISPEADIQSLQRGEPVTEEQKALPAPEERKLLPAPPKRITGPVAGQEIPNLVFSQKSPHTEVYTIGEDGIQSADKAEQDIITDIAGQKPSELKTPLDQAVEAAASVKERGSIYTPEVQQERGTLYANIPTKGNARRYGKSLQKLIDTYNELINNPKSYTSEAQFVHSGKLTQAAKRRLTALERAIQSTSDRSGIPVQGFEKAAEKAPVGVSEPSSEVNLTPQENTRPDFGTLNKRDRIEALALWGKQQQASLNEVEQSRLSTLMALANSKSVADAAIAGEPVNPAGDVKPSVPGYETLTPAQQNRLNQLLEKDQLEGLTENEVNTLEKLTTKAEQQSRGVRQETLHRNAKDAEELKQLAREANQNETIRQAQANEPTMGISRQEVKNAVREFVKALKTKPNVRVVNSLELADTEFADQASTARGLYIRKNGVEVVYLIEDNIPSADAALKTLMHEVLAHYGMRAIFSPKEREQIFNWVRKTAEGSPAYQEIEQGYAESFNTQKENGIIKNQEFKDLVAEEYIANLASSGTHMSLLARIIAKVKQFIRKALPRWLADKVSFTDNDIRSMLKDIHIILRAPVIDNNLGRKYVGRDNVIRASLAATNAANIEEEFGQRAHDIADAVNNLGGVWGIKFKKLFLTPLQMAEQYDLKPVQTYIQEVQNWWATKSHIISDADTLVSDWRNLGADESRKLARALFEISTQSDEEHRRLSREEILNKLQNEFKLSEDAIGMYMRIDESMLNLVDRLEKGLKYNVARESLGADPTEFLNRWNNATTFEEKQNLIAEYTSSGLGDIKLGARMFEIENQMAKMKERNYYPRMRFGQWTVAVRARQGSEVSYKGETFKDGDMIAFQTFESQAAARIGKEALEKEFKGKAAFIQESKLSDEEYSFIGLPPALFDMIESELNLTPDQKESLKDIYLRMSPGRSFLKQLRQRKGIEGYSEDAMRVYATYMMSAANHLARVEHHLDMQAPLDELGQMQSQYRELIPNNRTLIELTDYFRNHFKYIMNPKNDWAKLRALGFLWYLGANPKSALVNATQIPMVTYPYLSTRYGDAATVAQLAKAYKDVVSMLRGRGEGKISEMEDRMFNELLSEGVIDESQVTELAGIGEAPTLFRVMPEQADTRLLNKASYWAGFMFRQVEKYNRRVTALAGFRLAIQKGANYAEAYQAAKKTVQTTQYEYAKWNRPTFMRGKKSVLFLFWQYMQHTTYLMAGGQGQKTAMRMWMMMLMTAGLMGLPFAENILDLLDFGGTKMKEALGMKNPQVNLRDDIRELLTALTDRPDIFMHGLGGRYGLGPLHVLEALGVPVPNVNISGSLSLGQAIPGIHAATSETTSPDEKFGRTMIDILGPVAAMGYNLFKLAESDDPDTWKKYERAMPIAMKNASKALRYYSRGAETLRDATVFEKFDPSNPDQMAEIVAQGLGFTPSRLSAKYELRASQEDARRYWLTRRATIMQMYGYAQLTREGRADARKAIREYNASVPNSQLRIRQSDLRKSLKQRRHRKGLVEQGQPVEKRLRSLYQKKAALYPGASE